MVSAEVVSSTGESSSGRGTVPITGPWSSSRLRGEPTATGAGEPGVEKTIEEGVGGIGGGPTGSAGTGMDVTFLGEKNSFLANSVGLVGDLDS